MVTRTFRIMVGGLVVVAVCKLLLFEPRSKSQGKLTVMEPDGFWRQGLDPKKEDFQEKSPKAESLEGEADTDTSTAVAAVDTNPVPPKIVHLDLKGAAPKVKYLEQIFPLISSLGADGVLLEYEDMFPYSGELQLLRAQYAYSVEDVERIKSLAKLNKLEVIPLVQVFGHLEFVLKHEKYFHLREVDSSPNSLNPHHPASVALVKDMLVQVMDLHPEARWIHMGADEVVGLGESQDSKNWLHRNSGDVGKLFLTHAVALARFITERTPRVAVLMWDTMLRQINPAVIKESGLQNVCCPTIWNYENNIDTNSIERLIGRYQEAGFKGIWFASIFKGATDIDQQWTPLKHHLFNHLHWLKVMTSMSKHPSLALQGVLLTGWQRYDHYSVLCELLPASIPSLAMCLQTLKHGSFGTKAQEEADHILGCKIKVKENICEGSGAFSGSQIYHMVHHILTYLQKEVVDFTKHYHVRGGLSRYHRKYNFGNPRNIALFQAELKKLLEKWETYLDNFRAEMESIYFQDTVEEWMENNVNAHMDLLRDHAQVAEQMMKLNGRPKSLKNLSSVS